MTRVVVTGLGLATPMGADVDTVWERVLAGERAVTAPVRHGDVKPPTGAVGEIAGDVRATLEAREPEFAAAGEHRTWFGVAAAERAIEDAGLGSGPFPEAGAVLGSGPGVHRLEDVVLGLDADGRFDPAVFAARSDDVHPESLVRTSVLGPAEAIARRHGIGGPVHAVTTACSASNQALGLAYRLVSSGECPWVVAGGADSMINPIGLVFFVLLGAAAKVNPADPASACRPFDRKRSGLVMGEGAGCVVLESLEHARSRDAHILAEVVGYGSSLDAYRTTAPPRDGRGAAEAMAAALADGSVERDHVDFVNAHGTGTKRNDPAEIQAIRTVFGAHADDLAVSSGKGAMGHLLSGAAGVAFVLSVLAVSRGAVPPTSNRDNPDPEMDLDVVPNSGRQQRVRIALTNSFAFGGQNAVVAVRRIDAETDA